MTRFAEPVLVTVTTIGLLVVFTNWLGKVTVLELSDSLEMVLPVPARLKACGVPSLLLAMEMTAARGPSAVGLKVAVIGIDDPGLMVSGRVGVEMVKSPGFCPTKVMDEMFSAPLPLFPMVMLNGVLELPTMMVPKSLVRVLGVKVILGLVPVPLSAMPIELPALLTMVRVAARAPVWVGLKTTFTSSDFPALMVTGSGCVKENSAA